MDGEDPVLRITLGRSGRSGTRLTLTDVQFVLLLDEFEPDVRLMVETGMRVYEIIGLKWRAVDLIAV